MLYIIYKLKFCRLIIIIMLKNFMKPRKNASAIPLQKKNAEKRRAQKPVESDSEYSDSSDSEYEEILISSMKGGKTDSGKMNSGKTDSDKMNKNKEDPVLPPPLKLERQETKPVEDKDANHSNHFTEPKSDPCQSIDTLKSTISNPIDIPKPKPKTKSKRVVIKKYYNYKPKSERKKLEKVEKPVEKPVEKAQEKAQPKPVEKPRTSYIGIGKRSNPSVNMSNRLSNRILNW